MAKMPKTRLAALVCFLLLTLASAKFGAADTLSPPLGPDEIRSVPLLTGGLVYDPITRKLYASIPSEVSGLGNTITVIDPMTGALGPSVAVGPEPGQLAISDDSRYLYVGLRGAPFIQRIDLQSFTPDLLFSVGTDPLWGPLYANDITVMPGHPETIAVARITPRLAPPHMGVAIFDNGVPRPRVTGEGHNVDTIEFGRSPKELFGLEQESSGFEFYVLSVDADGVSVSTIARNLGTSFRNDLAYADGLLYTGSGTVIDPREPGPIGRYAAAWGLVVPEPSRRRAYFLHTGFTNEHELRVFDSLTYTPVGSVMVKDNGSFAQRLVRWGEDGLAFSTTAGLTLLRTSLVNGAPQPPPLPSLAPLGPDQIVALDLSARDLVYDAVRGHFYVSLPGTFGALGNSILTINPAAGRVGPAMYVGSEPGLMALSDDGAVMYVNLDGVAAVCRVDVAVQQPGRWFRLGYDEYLGHYFPRDMEVAPGNRDSVVMARRDRGYNDRGVAVYDGGSPRFRLGRGDDVDFGESAATLYGLTTETSEWALHTMRMDELGLTVTSSRGGVISTYGIHMEYYQGLIYTSESTVLDPATGAEVGRVNVRRGSPVRPDATVGRIFYVEMYERRILAYDLRTLAPLGHLDLPMLQGYPSKLLRWGHDGLAVLTDTGQVIFIRTSLVDTQVAPSHPAKEASPAQSDSYQVFLPLVRTTPAVQPPPPIIRNHRLYLPLMSAARYGCHR